MTCPITFDFELTTDSKADNFDPADYAWCQSKEVLEMKLIAEGDDMVEFATFISNRSQLDELWSRVEEIRKGEPG